MGTNAAFRIHHLVVHAGLGLYEPIRLAAALQRQDLAVSSPDPVTCSGARECRLSRFMVALIPSVRYVRKALYCKRHRLRSRVAG